MSKMPRWERFALVGAYVIAAVFLVFILWAQYVAWG
jgi:hypothetical protein